MIKTLIEGFLLGLSTGSTCLVTCSPIYLPWLTAEDNNFKKSLYKIMEISFGRFISYLIFGALAGYFGAKISPINREWFTGISYILLSVFLVSNAFRTTRHDKKCMVPKWAKISQSAFVLGLITGINFCPSFLIALSKSFELAGVIAGMLLFLGFFFGTTLFLIPLAFSGFLTAMPTFKTIARYASIAIAVYFLYKGAFNLYHTYEHHKYQKDSRTIELSDNKLNLFVFSTKSDSLFANTLADSLQLKYHSLAISYDDFKEIKGFENNDLLLIDSKLSLQGDTLHANIIKYHSDKNPSELLDFLRNTNFRTKKDKFIYWSM